MPSSTDRIEESVVLSAPRARVWRALTDVREFTQWFGVELTAAFEPGAVINGHVTNVGYEHVTMTIWVEAIEPQHAFSFRWHPNAIDMSADYSTEPTTLVVFTIDEVPEGTLLVVVESGFDALPESRRTPAFTSNSKGWEAQMRRIAKYLAENSGPSVV
ncbi:MAG: SRPBCC family protein [Gemmatimonadota bacterium]